MVKRSCFLFQMGRPLANSQVSLRPSSADSQQVPRFTPAYDVGQFPRVTGLQHRSHISIAQRLRCSSFWVMTCFLRRGHNILPGKELCMGLWEDGHARILRARCCLYDIEARISLLERRAEVSQETSNRSHQAMAWGTSLSSFPHMMPVAQEVPSLQPASECIPLQSSTQNSIDTHQVVPNKEAHCLAYKHVHCDPGGAIRMTTHRPHSL